MVVAGLQGDHELAAGQAPAIAVDAHRLADGLDLGVGGGIAQLLAAVDAGGELAAGGIVEHSPNRHIAGGGLARHREGALHAFLRAPQVRFMSQWLHTRTLSDYELRQWGRSAEMFTATRAPLGGRASSVSERATITGAALSSM